MRGEQGRHLPSVNGQHHQVGDEIRCRGGLA